MAEWNNHSSNIDASMVDAANSPSLLRGAFGRAALDEAQVSLIHNVARAQENMVLMARDSDTIAGVIESGSRLARSIQDAGNRLKERQKRVSDNIIFLELMIDANRYASQLAGEVAEIEAGYEAQYGDAWVEHIALEVLGPDELPEREQGEDIVSYRERLKDTLIAELIDPNTGRVRPEHAGSPHARWAERRWRHERVDVDTAIMNDKSLSQEERQAAAQRIVDTRDEDTITYANTGNEVGSEEYRMLGGALDEIRDDATTIRGSQSDWDTLIGP